MLFQPQYLHLLLFSFMFGLISLSFRSSFNCSKQGSTDVLLQDITIACFFLGMILRSWHSQSLYDLSNTVLVRHKTFIGWWASICWCMVITDLDILKLDFFILKYKNVFEVGSVKPLQLWRRPEITTKLTGTFLCLKGINFLCISFCVEGLEYKWEVGFNIGCYWYLLVWP